MRESSASGMPQIPLDPALLQCPNYAAPAFAPSHALLVNANTTQGQAAQLLADVWVTGNNLDRQQWHQQLVHDLAVQADQVIQDQEAAKCQVLLLAQEQDALRKEELKKNKLKYIPIPNRPMPTVVPVSASNYAIKKWKRATKSSSGITPMMV
jgi:hypothetical protein